MEKPFCTFVIYKVSFILIRKILSVHRIYTGPFCTFMIYKIYRTFLYIGYIQDLSVHLRSTKYTEPFCTQDIYRNLSVHLRSTKYTGPFCTFVGKKMLVQSLCITNLKFFILYIHLFTDFNGQVIVKVRYYTFT